MMTKATISLSDMSALGGRAVAVVIDRGVAVCLVTGRWCVAQSENGEWGCRGIAWTEADLENGTLLKFIVLWFVSVW
jgi:hypothetical protein